MSNQEIVILSLNCVITVSFLLLAASSYRATKDLEEMKDLKDDDVRFLTETGYSVFSSPKLIKAMTKLPKTVYDIAKVGAIGFVLSLIPLVIQIYYILENN